MASSLDNKLNHLWHQGYVELHRWELLSWYEKDRITNVVWRDISERWEALFEGEEPDILAVIECGDSTPPAKYLVINTDELENIENMS